MSAAIRWRELLAARAIPAHVLAAAPADPYRHDPQRFAAPRHALDTPSRRAALDLLDGRGSVLDVGAGAGAASLALLPHVSSVTGVDDATDMLSAFAKACLDRDVPYAAVLGAWPDVAPDAGTADVVVCHHVVYNTAELAPFGRALDAAARRGVVVELHDEHPTAWLDPLWRRFHALTRPPAATAEDAVAVLREAGLDPLVVRWRKPERPEDPRAEALRVTRRLCLSASRVDEVRAALAELPRPSRDHVTLHWRT